MIIIMATFDIQLRGCVRFPRYMLKMKPKKCPLFTIRKILNHYIMFVCLLNLAVHCIFTFYKNASFE